MNVLSRIIGAFVATALAWLGARLGIEFSPEDHATVTLWAVGGLVTLYGIMHPLIRAKLRAWRGLPPEDASAKTEMRDRFVMSPHGTVEKVSEPYGDAQKLYDAIKAEADRRARLSGGASACGGLP